MSTQLAITSSVFWGNSLFLERKMSGEVAIASGRYTTRYGIVELYGENYGKAAKPKPFFCFDFTYEGRVYRCSFDEWLSDGTIRRRAIRFVNECVALAPERSPTQWAYEQACAALDKHRQRADVAEAKLREIKEVAATFPEINPGNYTKEDACALNNWGIETCTLIDKLAA